jgi:peptidyl-prolyl isomerase E (cyclophilin E)
MWFCFWTKVHPHPHVQLQPPDNPEAKHRGFAFITYTQALDAHDAIDNMDMNEFRGRVLKVNLAKPQRGPVQGAGNRASTCQQALQTCIFSSSSPLGLTLIDLVWESEDWLQTHAQHAANRGGNKAQAEDKEAAASNDDAMEE